jgi:hypothetical protein
MTVNLMVQNKSDDTCCCLYCHKQHAHELLQWAHENGCPCTCGNDGVAAVAAVAAAVDV